MGWGIALIVIAVLLVVPGVSKLWQFLFPFGVVFVVMSVVRKKLRTRRDTEGLILGITALFIGVLDLIGIDLRFFPLIPTAFAVVGIALVVNAILSSRLRLDPTRPLEED
jgi:hypothetical protein